MGKYNISTVDQYYIVSEVDADLIAPVYSSSEVGSVAANTLVMTYGEALDITSTPETTDFVVNDGAVNAVTNVVVSPSNVTLTLTNSVVNGATVVVSYTKGANPLQDSSANECVNLTSESVTNNVAAPIYSAEYQAVYDSFTTVPNDSVANAQNAMVIALVSSGAWAKLDVFYLFAQESNGDGEALKNWVLPGTHDASLVNTSLFKSLGGIKPNGIDSYINTNFNISTDGVNYIQDSASLGYHSRLRTLNNQVDMGVAEGLKRTSVKSRNYFGIADTHPIARVNQGTVGWLNGVYIGSYGCFIANRTGATETSLFINTTKTIESGISTAPANVDMVIGAYDDGSIGNFADRQYSMAFLGGGLSDVEANSISAEIDAYLTTVSSKEASRNGALDHAGYCWFAREKVIHNAIADESWLGIVHDDGTGWTQHIAVIDSAGNVTTEKVGTDIEQDDHNEPTLLVRSSDSRIFTCYAEHQTDDKLRYRLSTNANDVSAFGSESIFTANSGVTYPSCFEDASGNIFIFYRETIACACYVKSTDAGVTFGGRVNWFSGFGQRGYTIATQSPTNKNLIYFSILSEHPIGATFGISVYSCYFDCSTETFHQLDGTDTTASIPFNSSTGLTPVMVNTDPDLAWIYDITLDSNGYPRFLMGFFPNGKNDDFLTKELYYAEWNGSAISTPYKIMTMGSRPISEDSGSYTPNACFAQWDAEVVIAGKDVNSVYEMFKYTRISASSFSESQITSDNVYDNWRPVTVNNTVNNLLFLRKWNYVNWDDFESSLIVETIPTT